MVRSNYKIQGFGFGEKKALNAVGRAGANKEYSNEYFDTASRRRAQLRA
jgi:hypothetical protein